MLYPTELHAHNRLSTVVKSDPEKPSQAMYLSFTLRHERFGFISLSFEDFGITDSSSWI